jgi:ArsR family transcriptional regulator, cadmium/lead-responsive transcriptional repressor
MTAGIDDDLWTALGDPTRLRVLDLLVVSGSGTASSVARHLPVTRQAVTKHLAILERAGLVHSEPTGREVRYEIDEAQFERARAQLDSVSRAWDRRLLRIKIMAEAVQRGEAELSATEPAINPGRVASGNSALPHKRGSGRQDT